MSLPLTETCLLCNAKVFSRAAHQFYCPMIIDHLEPAELKEMEEIQNKNLFDAIKKGSK